MIHIYIFKCFKGYIIEKIINTVLQFLTMVVNLNNNKYFIIVLVHILVYPLMSQQIYIYIYSIP